MVHALDGVFEGGVVSEIDADLENQAIESYHYCIVPDGIRLYGIAQAEEYADYEEDDDYPAVGNLFQPLFPFFPFR